jgi:CHASE2 domain-containing sensor protein
MIDRLLKIHLEPIARQRRRSRFLRALSLGWLAVVGLGLFCLLLRVTTGWRSPWTFLLLFVAAVIWALTAFVRNRVREDRRPCRGRRRGSAP